MIIRTLLLACLSLVVSGCMPTAVSSPTTGRVPELAPGTHHESILVPDVGKVNCAIRIDDTYDSSTPAPLVLVLHYGYKGSKPNPYIGATMMNAFKEAVSEIGGIAIAPDVVGGDWTRADNEHAAIWLVKSAMKTYNIDPNQVLVTGYSMGGAGTWHIAGNHQDLFTGAIPVAASVTGTTEWNIPVYAIHSQQDDVVPYSGAKQHTDSIKAAGGTVQFKTAPGLTHFETGGYSACVVEGVKWIRAQ